MSTFMLIFTLLSIVGITVTNLFGFWGTTGMLVLFLIVFIISLMYSESFREICGASISYARKNNNLHPLITGVLAFVFLILGIGYGAGEPLLITAFNQTYSFVNTEGVQKDKNLLLYGTKTLDEELKIQRAYFAYYELKFPLKVRANNEDIQLYQDKINNYYRYGVFMPNDEVTKLIASGYSKFKTDFLSKEVKNEKTKTWFFWKMFICLLLLTIFLLPFSFADEVCEYFESIIHKIEEGRRDIKAAATSVAAGAGTAAATTAVTSTNKAGSLGWFGEHFTANMAAEFTIRILNKFISVFKE